MKKILIVDDDKMSLAFMKLYFESKNLEIYTADSLSEAKNIFSYCLPDVIVTDIELSDGSGIDFINYAKEISKRNLLIIGVTGHSQEYLIESGNDINSFDLLLTKPVNLDQLNEAII